MISEDKYEVRVCCLTFFFGNSILRAVVRGVLISTLPRFRFGISNSDSGILTSKLRARQASDFSASHIQYPLSRKGKR